MKILSIRHNWPENPPFLIDRPNGCPEYVLLHFITPLLLLHDGKKQMIPAGSCIIYSPGHPQWFFSDKPILHDWMHLEGNIPEMMASVGLAPDTLYTPQESHILTELTAELESEFFAERAYKELFSSAEKYIATIFRCRIILLRTPFESFELKCFLTSTEIGPFPKWQNASV